MFKFSRESTLQVLAVWPCVLGVVAFAGWCFDFSVLTRIRPDFASMKLSTATCCILGGAAVWRSRKKDRLMKGFGLAIWLLAIQDLVIPGVRQAVFHPEPFEGISLVYGLLAPMSPATALGFLIIATSLLLVRRFPQASQWAALIALLIALFAITGYLYEVRSLYTLLPFSSMALSTAIALGCLAQGVLLIRPEIGFMKEIMGSQPGAVLARRLTIPLFILLLVTGGLVEKLEEGGWIDGHLDTAMVVIAATIFSAAMIWWSSRLVNRLGAERDVVVRYNEYLAMVVDSSADAILGTDLDGEIVAWNRGAERMFGYSKEEMTGQSIHRLSGPEQEAEVNASLERLREGKSDFQIDTVRLDKNQRPIPVSITLAPIPGESGEVSGASVTIRDISSRKKAEREARDLRLALDHHAIVSVTDSKGRITYVNDKFCQISRYSREELIGQDYRIVNSGYHSKEFFKNLWDTILDGKVWSGEIRNRSRDGDIYWVATTIVPFLNEHGKRSSFIAIRADITALKKAEEENRLLNESLEKRVEERTLSLVEANNELKSFSYTVSHDLRAPLRSISGFSQAIAEDYTELLDDAGRDYLQRVINASQRMGHLIDDMLKLSLVTQTEINRRQVDVTAIAREILERCQERDPERVVETEIADGITVEADEALLRILLENLIGNAWKFSAGSNPGRITVGMTDENNEKTEIVVRDNGTGFDMNYSHLLFEAFQRLHRSEEYPGEGIGLAIVARIAKRHGGSIRAESQEGEGAAFFFSL